MKRLQLFLLLSLPLAVGAQTDHVCGTEHMYQQRLKSNPDISQVRAAGELNAQQYAQKHQGQKAAGVLRVIPVVVHIIHNYGSENISKAQVLDALRILNEDFQAKNPDTNLVIPQFKQLIGNAEVEFRLANKDPNGNCTDGITRTVSNLTFNADDNVKGLISWDNAKYYNIWVVHKISFGAGGYAYYPGTASAGYEGVVVCHSQFGSIGTSGGSNFAKRTLTHETGHYLNLPHTWGSSNACGDANNCSVDDGVADTPNTIGNCLTCNLTNQNCGSLDNVQNYMDYATCTRMFTIGQKNRMDAALNSSAGYRNLLWQASNLIATGTQTSTQSACILNSDFVTGVYNICEGNTITYTDISWNGVANTWSWSFPGGTPSSSTAQNPTIQYNSAGIYAVSLTASNTAGTGNSMTKTSYIRVRNDSADHSNWQYIESFEGKPIPNTDWTLVNPDNGVGWYQTNVAAKHGFKSARIDNLNNWPDEVDELISPSIDLTAVSSPPGLYFKVAYAPVNTGDNDKLAVYISLDCGHSWQIKYLKKGPALATAGNQSTNFVPNANQWSQEYLNLAPYAGQKNILFKFAFTYAGGNNIYLDDINITSPVGIAGPVADGLYFGIYPNPAERGHTISYRFEGESQVSLSLHDVAGREISRITEGTLAGGSYDHQIDMPLSKGLYFVNLVINGRSWVKKMVVN